MHGLLALGLLGCHREPQALERPTAAATVEEQQPQERQQPEVVPPAEPVADVPASAPEIDGVRHFDDQPIFVGNAASGPGLASWAKLGQVLHLISPGGTRWEHELTVVMLDGCEARAPLDTCAYISFDTDRETVGNPTPWKTSPFEPTEVDLDDAALQPVFLASINAPAPDIVLESFSVDYRKALCEHGEDGEYRVLMTEVTSTAPDPLARATALGKRRALPRRTLSIDVDGATLHFAFISSIAMPSDRTMLSLDRDRTEWFWVARENKGKFTVLLDQRTEARRGFNHDIACQLPVAAPMPFVLRREPAGLTVYTNAPRGVQRWRVRDDSMVLDATFEVLLHEN